MATLKIIRNGATANGRRKRRRNSAKKNPVSKVTRRANPRITRTANPKRRRRNGIAARRNGFFGDTKADVKNVLALTGGAIGTNVAGNTLAGLLAPYIATVGLGAYSSIIAQTAIAMFGVPYIARSLAGNDAAKMARLGGLLSVTLDVLGTFFPQFNSLNPFSTSPIVMSGNQIGITPEAVKQIAKSAAEDTAAKIAGFAAELEQGGNAMSAGSGWTNDSYFGGEMVS